MLCAHSLTPMQHHAHAQSPYCRDFAPHVLKSHAALATDRRCKVIFMSADKSDENYEIMCNKLKGIPTLPYDLTKTQFTRDLFNLKTIPVLIILRNKHFDREVPDLVTNARHLLVEDPTLSQVQWEEPDWRRTLFGSMLSLNDGSDNAATLSVEEVLSADDYNYVAVFIGGQHW